MAEFHILVEGYAREDSRVACTVAFVPDGDRLIVIDPGMVPSQAAILDPLEALGVGAGDVTDVVFSHHHPDHTLNAGLFPEARFHDYWAVYRGDLWESRPADGVQVSPSVRLMATPGHTLEDITTLVDTDEGVVAFTHLWPLVNGPPEPRLVEDREALHANRERVLEVASLIVPGHGAPFVPGPKTPR